MKKSNDIKHRLRAKYNMTLKQFCIQYGYHYRTASDVVRGVNRATFGNGRIIAEKLNELVGAGL